MVINLPSISHIYFICVFFIPIIHSFCIQHQNITPGAGIDPIKTEEDINFLKSQISLPSTGSNSAGNVTFFLTDQQAFLNTTVNANVEITRRFIESLAGFKEAQQVGPHMWSYGMLDLGMSGIYPFTNDFHLQILVNGKAFPDGSYMFVAEASDNDKKGPAQTTNINPLSDDYQKITIIHGGILLTPQSHGLGCNVSFYGNYVLNDAITIWGIRLINDSPLIPYQIYRLQVWLEKWVSGHDNDNGNGNGNKVWLN